MTIHGIQTEAPEQNQEKRFIETARQLECDEDKERFEAKMKRIAKVKPTKEPVSNSR